ncbi:uncharacterized protein FOMMEDRAFT_20241 [Fomitiporia mediterranea MF3/22]|uniref:uncharacterized protein n=1 Tax=Fomitiporia mediterranea (strain MF3/22) TaxID=694068 RepID=UPI0004409405|nr:uncharacterized protein FOMMEDRAFT_20241 [Fomitiporia mediterranea MF3/22]EJD03069.1 hypothetical protein FOMMEDRAFT_20241 [Fomitiporia mediterranea MF3/22]
MRIPLAGRHSTTTHNSIPSHSQDLTHCMLVRSHRTLRGSSVSFARSSSSGGHSGATLNSHKHTFSHRHRHPHPRNRGVCSGRRIIVGSSISDPDERGFLMNKFAVNAPASSRWPELHPVLAMDTTRVIFDVRVPPEQAINSEAYTRFWNESALRRPTTHMRLVSQDHPWTFELDFRPLFAKKGTPHYVTCGDVWTALTSGLARPITDAEWALFTTTNRPEQAQKKNSMTQTVATRKVEHGKFLRRVDWLGANIIFRGLVKDDKYAGDVLLPGREPCAETWLVKFSAARA